MGICGAGLMQAFSRPPNYEIASLICSHDSGEGVTKTKRLASSPLKCAGEKCGRGEKS